jgi:methyl-accepting chemotaxis protein
MTKSEYRELADFFVDHLGRHKQEMRALIEVSVESLRDEIRIVADGVLTNGRRIDEQTRRIDEHSRRIDENTRRIDEQSQRIDEQSQRIDEHSRRMDENTAGLAALSLRVGIVEVTTERIDTRVAGIESALTTRLADHESRIRALEKKNA